VNAAESEFIDHRAQGVVAEDRSGGIRELTDDQLDLVSAGCTGSVFWNLPHR
jgi:hypothetical protein